MHFCTKIYLYYIFFYTLKMILFVVFYRLVVFKYEEAGIETFPFTLYTVHNCFMTSFISFLTLSTLYFSKKQEYFTAFIIIEGSLLLESTLYLPFVTLPFLHLGYWLVLFIGYFIVISNYRIISSILREYSSKKINYSDKINKIKNVSIN